MMKRSRMIIRGGLLDYAQIRGMEKPKSEARPERLSLLTKLWKSVV
jgi:hypothetical protein